jgi:hypothetical protein
MTHPAHDAKLRAIVGERRAGESFCEECVRWESGYGRHARPSRSAVAVIWYRMASALTNVATYCTRRGDIESAWHNLRTGQLHSVARDHDNKRSSTGS